MDTIEIIHTLFDLDAKAIKLIQKYAKKRFIYTTLQKTTGRPFVGLIGPRGVGKTVLFRQLRSVTPASIYISADTINSAIDIKKILITLYQEYSITSFFIDEVHFIKNHQQIFKELYDFYEIKLWFTSSVSLSLFASTWDLSRRVTIIELLPFSFREYIYFKYNISFKPLHFTQLLEQKYNPEYLKTGQWFNDYLSGGLFPYFLEKGITLQQHSFILEEVINSDIPSLHPDMRIEEIAIIKKIVSFIGKSPIDGINYSSVAHNHNITKYKSEKYLSLLERAYIILLNFPAGTNILKEPKVFLFLPYRLLYKNFDECIGELREDFFAIALKQHGIDFNYCKTTRGRKTPDFIIHFENKNILLEIGGKNKGYSQFKGLDYDEKVVLYHGIPKNVSSLIKRIPLHLLGFS